MSCLWPEINKDSALFSVLFCKIPWRSKTLEGGDSVNSPIQCRATLGILHLKNIVDNELYMQILSGLANRAILVK